MRNPNRKPRNRPPKPHATRTPLKGKYYLMDMTDLSNPTVYLYPYDTYTQAKVNREERFLKGKTHPIWKGDDLLCYDDYFIRAAIREEQHKYVYVGDMTRQEKRIYRQRIRRWKERKALKNNHEGVIFQKVRGK